MNDEIPETHPRYKSLVIRERLRDFMEKGIVVPEGLIAHGRGEAFDYIFGEASQDFALESEKAAISLLMLSKNPVITVNGNVAALSYKEIVELHNVTGIKVEINLFHRSDERIKKIAELFQREGLTEIYGIHADKEIPGLVHNRRFADGNGIYSADTVFIPLEDGDRAMSLKNMGKKVIAIDLNPFSRTSITADISIIDEIT
ncbi:MAG: phosphopantothenate/pantothenate synthetase, partial [Candidatus Thermoplasmatota archaeon]|nr:phosphopantothenate/pantothenate synthetase [Candidatus Thermoplasmatota archaeon]